MKKYWLFLLLLIQTLMLQPAGAGLLTEDVTLIKRYEKFFMLLAKMLPEFSDTDKLYWPVELREHLSTKEKYLFVKGLPSHPIQLPEGVRKKYGPFPWVFGIKTASGKLEPLDELYKTGCISELSVHLGAFPRDPETPFKPKNPFRQVTRNQSPGTGFLRQNATNLYCHYQYADETDYEICIEFSTVDTVPLEKMRDKSRFRKGSVPVQGLMFPIDQPYFRYLGGEKFEPFVFDLLKTFEQGITGSFLNQHDTLDVDVSSKLPRVGKAQAWVLGRGQFSVVFTIENVIPGLALRRFPGFSTLEDARNFLVMHEAALVIYEEMKLNIEPTRLLVVPAADKRFTVYMLQRRLAPEELAEYYIEGFFLHGPNEIVTTLYPESHLDGGHSAKLNQEVGYPLSYGEAVGLILHANIEAIYENLASLTGDDSSLTICSDAKPDNFSVKITYREKWHNTKDFTAHWLETVTDLTDFHPCTLVLHNEVLFDGGPEGAKLTILLGRNPFGIFKDKIRNLPNAKKLITKLLANIAHHGGDQSDRYMPELVDRLRQILIDYWESDPLLNERYQQYKLSQWGYRSVKVTKGLPQDKLFFDPNEITSEGILNYRKNSEKANARLKLNYLLLRKASELSPGQFGQQDYIPVDYQQDWWLRSIDLHYSDELDEVLRERLAEIDSKSPIHHPSNLQNLEENTDATRKLHELLDRIINDEDSYLESKIRRLFNWHLQAAHTADLSQRQSDEFQQMIRDHTIQSLEALYGDEMDEVIEDFFTSPLPDSGSRELMHDNFELACLVENIIQGNEPDNLENKLQACLQQPSPARPAEKPRTVLTGTPIEAALLSDQFSASPQGMSKAGLNAILSAPLNQLPLRIASEKAMTFPQAYSRLPSRNWKAVRGKPAIPLARKRLLRLEPGVYSNSWLAQQLQLIPSDEANYFPRYDHRDTIIQAIKASFEHTVKTPDQDGSYPNKPLVVVDLSASVDEADLPIQKGVPPSGKKPARVILFATEKPQGQNIKIITQKRLALDELKQMLYSGQPADYLVRMLRADGNDLWFIAKPLGSSPSPVPPELASSKAGNSGGQCPASTASPLYAGIKRESTSPSYYSPQPKKPRLKSPAKSPPTVDFIERQRQASRAEQSARQYIQAHRLEILPTAGDHFCLYRSLAKLLNERPLIARHLLEHLAKMLRELIQMLPQQQQALAEQGHGDIAVRLYSNIIFLALQHVSSRRALRFELAAVDYDLLQFQQMLRTILRQLLIYRQFHAGIHIDILAVWPQVDTAIDDAPLWQALNTLLDNTGINAGFDMVLANAINDLVQGGAGLGAGVQNNPHSFFATIALNIAAQWEEETASLHHHSLFFGMGLQVLNNLLQHPTTANWEQLNGFLATQPGQQLWGSNFMLHDLFIPLLDDAGIWQPIVVLHPALEPENPQVPLVAQLIDPANPANGILSPAAIQDWLHNADALILFNGGLNVLGLTDIAHGTHWQPVLPPQPYTGPSNAPDPQAEDHKTIDRDKVSPIVDTDPATGITTPVPEPTQQWVAEYYLPPPVASPLTPADPGSLYWQLMDGQSYQWLQWLLLMVQLLPVWHYKHLP